MSDLEYLTDFAPNKFWSCAKGRWHPITVFPKTGETRKNDKGWKVLWMECRWDEDNEQLIYEVPFWARSGLIKVISDNRDMDEISLLYKREVNETLDDPPKTLSIAKWQAVLE